MFEVFSMIDGNSHGTTETDDRKISREEWNASIVYVKEACNSFADFICLKNPSKNDFDVMDLDGKGSVLLMEFCMWIKMGEIKSCTDLGKALSKGEDINNNILNE
jgi:hypothetical protein